MSFTNKVVLVTGASGGIGAAIAIAFAAEGVDVAIVGRNQDKLNNVADKIAKFGRKPLVIRADIANDNEARATITRTIDVYGKLDVLVNNAGILKTDSILDVKFMETFDSIMNTNMRALVLVTNSAAPYLVKSKGNIINISSVSGKQVPRVTLASYAVSKAVLEHFTRCIALELASAGVRVNSVSPGLVVTDILNTAGMQVDFNDFKSATALGRISAPEEITDLVLFLASEKAKSITGSDYVSDNGMLLKYFFLLNNVSKIL